MNTPYLGLTEQFGGDEMRMLENFPAGTLAESLKHSSPVIALRAMAEVMLNGDDEKLKLLLADEELTAFWRLYKSDYGLDPRDDEYAEKLEAKLKEMK